MAKILLYLSGVLLLLSAGLGWMNRTKYNDELTKRKDTEQKLSLSQDEGRRLKKTLDTTQKEKDAAIQLGNDLKSKLTEAQQQVTQLQEEKTKTEQQIAETNTQMEDLKKKLEVALHPDIAPPPPGFEIKMKELEQHAAELEQVRKTQEEQLKAADANLRKLREDADRRARGALKPGLTGTIRAVDHGWNFVVLDLGDRQGVVTGAEMVIERGGNMVGKVRITSVEPNQSIADILPNSVPPGVTIQRGDRVIFPGS